MPELEFCLSQSLTKVLMFSLSHCTTQEMVSLIFFHLFTSLILKGIVITTPTGRGLESLPGYIFKIYPPVISNLCLENKLCHSPLLITMLQPHFLLPLNMPSSLTSQGLLHLLVLPEIISSFRHQFKYHHLSGDHPSPSGKSHSVSLSCCIFFSAFYPY